MRTKITTKSTKIIVREYNKVGHTDTIMSVQEFLKKYRQNVLNAFLNWSVAKEEGLPISILGNTQEQTRKNMFKYFLKNFCVDFNYYAYMGYIHRIDNKEGYCYCRCWTEDWKEVSKEIPYVHCLNV